MSNFADDVEWECKGAISHSNVSSAVKPVVLEKARTRDHMAKRFC